MKIEPYLDFNGRCEEAIEFYKAALGAEVVTLMRFRDVPGAHPAGAVPPEVAGKVMHATLRIGGATVMLSDGRNAGATHFAGTWLSLQLPDAAAAERAFAALADGGRVQMPLGQTFWSPKFGMVADRFGVAWMVGVAAEAAPAAPTVAPAGRYVLLLKPETDPVTGVQACKEKKPELVKLIGELRAAGTLLGTEVLRPGDEGTRVRLSGARRAVTDGPFTEAKEVIAGFVIVRAGSTAEAAAIGERILEASGGGECEVRRIDEGAAP